MESSSNIRQPRTRDGREGQGVQHSSRIKTVSAQPARPSQSKMVRSARASSSAPTFVGSCFQMPVAPRSEDSDRDLYSGLIRLHILHHAVKAPIFGLGMQEELGRHGYRISPGTRYPLLNGLEKKGYLRSWEERDGKSRRRLFRATPTGRQGYGPRGRRSRTIHRNCRRQRWVALKPALSVLTCK